MDFERFSLLHVDCLQPPNQPTSHIQLVIHFTSFFCCLELKNHLKSSVDFDATTCCFVFLLETKEKSLIFRIELLLFTLSSSVVVSPGRSRMKNGSNIHSCSNLGKRTWTSFVIGIELELFAMVLATPKFSLRQTSHSTPCLCALPMPSLCNTMYYILDMNFNETSKYKFYNLSMVIRYDHKEAHALHSCTLPLSSVSDEN